jgi:hypothetical protein
MMDAAGDRSVSLGLMGLLGLSWPALAILAVNLAVWFVWQWRTQSAMRRAWRGNRTSGPPTRRNWHS